MVGFFDFFDAYQVNGQRHPKGLLYAQACTDFGLTQDMMQPTLMMLPGELYLTVRVDDAFLIGSEEKLKSSSCHT